MAVDGQGLGIRPQYSLQRHQVSDRIELLVNLFNGNVVVLVQDLVMRGTGLSLAVDHVYNNQAPTDGPQSFGRGWTATLGPDVGLDITTDAAVLRGTTAYRETFTRDGGEFVTPPRMDADLTEQADGTYLLEFRYGPLSWVFDEQGRLSIERDDNGNTITYTYSNEGLLEAVTDTQDRTTSFAHDAAGRITAITDPTGTTFGAFSYDTNGNLVSYEDRAGFLVEFGYDTSGNLTRLTSPNRRDWTLAYDQQGRATSLSEPLPGMGQATYAFEYTSDQGQAVTNVTDPLEGLSVFVFDDQGRQTQSTDQMRHLRQQSWSPNSDIATTTDAEGHTTTWQYDPVTNNLIGTELPTGATTSLGYADATHPYRVTSITDPQGASLEFSHDDAGNVTSVYNPGSEITVVARTYNPDGTVATQTDGKGAATTFTYDSVGNLTAVQPPDPRGAQRYTYDTLSRIATATDGNGTTLGYDYDPLDRVLAIVNLSATGRDVREENHYDRNGNLTTTISPDARTDYTYTPRNELASSVRTTRWDTEFVDYGYDASGNVSWMQDVNGVTRYHYDPAYRVISLDTPWGQNVRFAYDNENRRTRTVYPGGASQQFIYDAAGRVGTMRAYSGNTVLDTSTYIYALPDGTDTTLLRSVSGWASPNPAGNQVTFSYDGLNRLVQAGSFTYGYDDATNVISTPAASYQINDADQVTQTGGNAVAWDEAGNLAAQAGETVSYSPTSQQTSRSTATGPGARYAYATADTSQLHYHYARTATEEHTERYTHTAFGITSVDRTVTDAGSGQVLQEQRLGFVRDPDGRLIAWRAGGSGNMYYYYADHQNTVHALFNAQGTSISGYTYGPYGSVTTIDVAAEINPFRWIGSLQLPTGEHYLTNRYYNIPLVRFTQPDPSSQELNPYTYAEGDPVNKTDATGLNACAWTFVGAGAIFTYAGIAASATGAGLPAGVVLGSASVVTGAAGAAVC